MTNPPTPPKLLTGRELYDAIMQHIEPELTTDVAATLAQKYQNEDPQDKSARLNRYELAFERCEEAFNDYVAALNTQVKRYRRDAYAHAEMEDREDERGLLNSLGLNFSSNPS